MKPLQILEKESELLRTMKLIEKHPGKTTADLKRLTKIGSATFYRHVANLRRLELVTYKQKENETGRPIVYYPKYKIEVKKL